MTCHSNKIKLAKYNRRAFTLIEVAAAVMLLAFIAASVLTVMNRCIAAVTDSRTRTEAFEIARENMEHLLAADKAAEKTEFGISETNPDIQWETVIETFTEPVTYTMWLQAVCSASYTDKDGEIQYVEFKHWLSEISKTMQKKIEEQNEKELEMMEDSEEAIKLLEDEYKKNLANALGIDPDEIDNFDIPELEKIAEDEGIDPEPIKKIEPEPEDEYKKPGTHDPSKPIGPGNWPPDWSLDQILKWLREHGYMK
ncbi:MAG: prepilin-type N-terminal cleavage/methylation domain-containing protein [Planctomycetes bacterium]|nr:prepilin-type N-terminal cleavage/methylation domain-containing protein [Planctomycetota bacterium]